MLQIMPLYHLSGDLGTEFTNRSFIKYLNDNNIEYNFFKSDSSKLGIINRFHRTLKNKITNFMTVTGSVRWIDVLSTIMSNYNMTYHRGIKNKPIIAFKNPIVESKIIQDKKMLSNEINAVKVNFSVGDKVRVLNPLSLFENKMKPKYSDEIYIIAKVNTNTLTLHLTKNGVITTHLYKKSRVILVDKDTSEAPIINTDLIKKSIRKNKQTRLNKKEDLITDLTDTRTRQNPKKKIIDN